MTTLIHPNSARFKNNTLFMNLSEKTFNATEESIASGYDLAFIFAESSVYIELDPGLRFGVVEHETGEHYGPYDDALKVVQKHLFGLYDNLLTFLTNNIVFDQNIGAYAVKMPNMYYYRGSYDLGGNLPKTTRELKSLIPRIDRDFEFELEAKTFFAEGSIELFLNRLNLIFNIDTFNESYKDGEFYSAGIISRASGTAIEQSNGNRFFILNTSKRRHASYVVPKITTDNFIEVGSGSDSCDYVIDHYINDVEEIVETNAADIEYYKDMLGHDVTEKTFTYKPLGLFDDIKLILVPEDNVRFLYYFVKIFDDTIKIVKFDAFTKTMVVYDESKATEITSTLMDGSVSISDNTIAFIYKSDDFVADGASVKIAIKSFKWATYPGSNKLLNEDGNIYSFGFAKNLLKTVFSGV
jgi:hypothetical protein